MEVGRPRESDKDSLCLGSQETATDFLLGSYPRIVENSSIVGQSSTVLNRTHDPQDPRISQQHEESPT